MGTNYEYEPFVSPEQEKAWNTLYELSEKLNEMINMRRKKALMVLVDKSKSPQAKRTELCDYFSFRMDPDAYVIQDIDGNSYSLQQIADIAKSLNTDVTFYYNDNWLVLNNLDPFFASITPDDVILAYHNYRLSSDDGNLSHFVKLIGLYTAYALDNTEFLKVFSVYDAVFTHEESINHLKTIIMHVDKYLEFACVNRCSQKSFPIQSSTHTYSGQSN